MSTHEKRALRVFLCHASDDKLHVRRIYKNLVREGVDVWLDKENLLPGQDWQIEIPLAVERSDVIIVFLSKNSISKEGYVQKEIKIALDIADEKPVGTIFLIPARIEDCLMPVNLRRWQWVDLFEENGFEKLLLSLKNRANAIGAIIAPAFYGYTDQELEHKLDNLYTEGLAAFLMENWDKACQCFQEIVKTRPSYLDAVEKLEESELQRDTSALYKEAESANQNGDWDTAITALEEVLNRKPGYKESAQLLQSAKQQKVLADLYNDARRLFSAQKWHAVVKAMEKILSVDPNYQDSDNMLPVARQEVMEMERVAELNELYGQAVREIDKEHWQEAQKLLLQVQKSQPIFLETDGLLKKVAGELVKIEEKNKLDNKLNVLYEQAHGFVRARNWREASNKVREIFALNAQFEDRDGIIEKIEIALAQEEQDIQKQNQLAKLYAEAVRLLKADKYSEALTAWEEIKSLDPKFPDRQQVQKTAKRKMRESANSGRLTTLAKWGLGILIMVAFLITTTAMLIANLFSTSNHSSATETFDFITVTNTSDQIEVPVTPTKHVVEPTSDVQACAPGNNIQAAQNGSNVVVTNISQNFLSIRISWDEKDPWGNGDGPDSYIDNWVGPSSEISQQVRSHESAQIWAWDGSATLVDYCELLIAAP